MDTIAVVTTLLELVIPILMVINAARAVWLALTQRNKTPYLIQAFAFAIGTTIILMPEFLPPEIKLGIEFGIFLILLWSLWFNRRGRP